MDTSAEKKIRLIELGPGKGTLMADVLRVSIWIWLSALSVRLLVFKRCSQHSLEHALLSNLYTLSK